MPQLSSSSSLMYFIARAQSFVQRGERGRRFVRGTVEVELAARADARKGDFVATLVFRNIAARKTMLLLLAALGSGAEKPREQLPSIDVTGWHAPHLRDLFHRCERHSWFVQLGEKVFSPALGLNAWETPAADLERETSDAGAGAYSIYRGAPLPAPLAPYSVGSTADAFILRLPQKSHAASHAAPAGGDACSALLSPGVADSMHRRLCRNLAPLAPGLQSGVPYAQLLGTHTLERTETPQRMELERDGGGDGGDGASKATRAAVEAAGTPDGFMGVLSRLSREFTQRSVLSAHLQPSGVHEARDYLRTRLEALGMETRLQSFKVPMREFRGVNLRDDVPAENVLGCWPGSGPGVVVLGAHYDSIPDASLDGAADHERGGGRGSPGAMDDGSGVAVLLHSLAALRSLPLAPTVYTTFFSAEEQGSYGAQAVVRDLTVKAPQFQGALILDMTTEFKGTGSDGRPHPPCHLANGAAACDGIMLDTQGPGRLADLEREGGDGDGDGVSEGQRNLNLLNDLVGSAEAHSKSGQYVRVTKDPVSIYHTDTTPFWEAGLPAVYGATIAHRLYPQWHDHDDTLRHLGGELGADISRMLTGWLAGHHSAGGTVDLERNGHEKAACFSHFRDGALTENPKPFGSGERLSAAASLEKTALALGALTEPADPLVATAE